MFKHIRKSSLSIVLASSLLLLSGCGEDRNEGVNSVPVPGQSQFISAEVIDEVSASAMLSIVNASLDPTAKNAFAYKAVKITYLTSGENDEPIVASGLLVVPSATAEYQAFRVANGEDPFTVSMLCDNHGTIFTDAEAPTNIEVKNGMPDYPLAVSMTGYAGFAGIYPDYIGYGVSNKVHPHPYMLKKSSVRASLDMIKASMKYMQDTGVAINYQLFISGYSQGGHLAMALAEKVEKEFDGVSLKGVAPMAGPYLVDAFGDATLKAGAKMAVPAFMAWMADSYSNTYSNLTLDEMVLDSKLPAFTGLFDGSNSLVDVQTALMLPLGANTEWLFKSTFISDYESTPSHKFRTMLKQNNVGEYAATTKIKLIHCTNDDVIPAAMTAGVEMKLNSFGSTSVETLYITGVDANASLGESVHGNCARPAYQQAIGWFSAIRTGDIK